METGRELPNASAGRAPLIIGLSPLFARADGVELAFDLRHLLISAVLKVDQSVASGTAAAQQFVQLASQPMEPSAIATA